MKACVLARGLTIAVSRTINYLPSLLSLYWTMKVRFGWRTLIFKMIPNPKATPRAEYGSMAAILSEQQAVVASSRPEHVPAPQLLVMSDP